MRTLYQLFSPRECRKGEFFFIDGPYDNYGYVLKSEKKEDGKWLNLIRGTGKGEEGRYHAENCTPANLM